MVIGIPRALLYYKYWPLWETFLNELGLKIVTSPSTNKAILQRGLEIAESEICAPVKIFYGHVAHLIEKAKVDAVFLPRMVAVEKPAYTCPKFLGLPDMIKAAFPEVTIITEDFNRKLGLKSFYASFFKIAKLVEASSNKALHALVAAKRKYRKLLKLLHKEIPYQVAAKWLATPENIKIPLKSSSGLKIGIAAHAYNIYDEYFSLNLLRKLEKMGIWYLTPDNIPKRYWSLYSARLPKFLFWTYERELVGSAFYWIEQKKVDGIIYVMSFACGPDSIVQYVLEDEARKYGLPLLTLVLDEHAGEAGLLTRLEAFIDMLGRKKQ
jgi:predicted nucleotide-binding protein (sugar kinase/HSP70/actin superfamily)